MWTYRTLNACDPGRTKNASYDLYKGEHRTRTGMPPPGDTAVDMTDSPEGAPSVTHDPLPTLFADLAQLFQNLLSNALKYKRTDPPRMHVSAKKNRAKEWAFSVRDNGLGIEPRYFERIFLMFQRLHGREEFSGAGIGLSLCRKIVERHAGRIWVESRPGEGSTFYVALPAGGV